MKILAFIEVRHTSREEFEYKYPRHSIVRINDQDFLDWCNMCPDPITLGQVFVFIDEDNQKLEQGSSSRKAHADHFAKQLDI